MESKLMHCASTRRENSTFNRTSMESKLTKSTYQHQPSKLLIEPVWNRNISIADMQNALYGLLIEPVWNRNGQRR